MIELMRLYDAGNNFLNLITEFSDLVVTEALNTVYSAEFSVPLGTDASKQIEIEGFIEFENKRFTIKELTPHLASKTLEVYAIGDCDGLKYVRCSKFECSKKTAYEAIDMLLEGRDVSTGWSVVYGSSDPSERPTAKRSLKLSKSDAGTVWGVLQKIIDKWHVEIDFDCKTHTMRLYKSKRLGQQSVLTVFYEDLNLLDFERSIESNEVVNNIIASGKDNLSVKGAEREDGSIVSGTSIDEVRDLFKDAPAVSKVMRGYYLDTQEDDKQELYDAAVDYLEDHCSPSKSYTIKVSDLTAANPNYSEFYEVGLGDTIGIASHTLDARYNLRVVKITRHPNEVDSMEIELSNRRASIASSSASERRIVNAMIDTYQTPMVGDTILVGDRAIATDNIQIEAITADLLEGGSTIVAKEGQSMVEALMESTVEKVQTNLSNSDGVYKLIYNTSGQPIGMEIVSTSDSNKLWRWDYGGLRYSKDGGATFSNIAIDFEGNVVAKNIASGSVISNSVTMSNLSLTGGSISINASSSNENKIGVTYGTYTGSISPQEARFTNGSNDASISSNSINVSNGTSWSLIQPTLGYIDAKRILTAGDALSEVSGSTIYPGHVGGDGNAPVVYFSTSQSSSAQAGRFSKSGNTYQLTDYSGSSRRFKHDIEPLDNKWLEAIHGLYNAEVKRWTYNDDYIVDSDDLYQTETIGLIAEEVAEILPTVGITDCKGDVENYRERQLINAMLVLIQEQNKRLCEVEEKLRKLEENK